MLAGLAAMIATDDLEVPIARVYRPDEIREAYRELERPHTPGKIVQRP